MEQLIFFHDHVMVVLLVVMVVVGYILVLSIKVIVFNRGVFGSQYMETI